MDETKKPVIVKKYANRRLYNTETSTYVTLEDLAAMVRAERDFIVYDAKSNEDLTHSVLTQIILEQESRGGETLLPINFLRQLIRFYGDSVGRLVPSYLDLSIGMLTREQEKYRKQMADALGGTGFPPFAQTGFAKTPFGQTPFGASALEAMQEQTRKNMVLFEQTMASLWAPFTPPGDAIDGIVNGTDVKPANGSADIKTASNPKVETAGKGNADSNGKAAPADDELATMRQQITMLQKQLDRLAQSR
jgi:polyhydroxyalkanoate synthesis repressor PhaR